MALFLEPKGSTSLRVFGLNNAKGAISLTGLCWHPSPGATASEQGTLAKEESAVGLDDQSVSPTPDSSPSKGPESSAAFWQKLDRETVVRLAEQYHLSITIRPDGSTIGFPSDLRKLRALLGGEGGEGQGKGKGL